jgi:hypothetical protein
MTRGSGSRYRTFFLPSNALLGHHRCMENLEGMDYHALSHLTPVGRIEEQNPARASHRSAPAPSLVISVVDNCLTGFDTGERPGTE